jgi:hypothetical protein
MVHGLWSMARRSGCSVEGLWFGVQELGLMASGSCIRV